MRTRRESTFSASSTASSPSSPAIYNEKMKTFMTRVGRHHTFSPALDKFLDVVPPPAKSKPPPSKPVRRPSTASISDHSKKPLSASRPRKRTVRYTEFHTAKPLRFNVNKIETDEEQKELQNKKTIPVPKFLSLTPKYPFEVHSRMLAKRDPLNKIDELEYSPAINSARDQQQSQTTNPRLMFKSTLTRTLEPGYNRLETLKEKLKKEYEVHTAELQKLVAQKKKVEEVDPQVLERQKYELPSLTPRTAAAVSADISDKFIAKKINKKAIQVTSRIKMYEELMNQFENDNDLKTKEESDGYSEEEEAEMNEPQKAIIDNTINLNKDAIALLRPSSTASTIRPGSAGSTIRSRPKKPTVTFLGQKEAEAKIQQEQPKEDAEDELGFPLGLDSNIKCLVAQMFANPKDANTISQKEHDRREREYILEKVRKQQQEAHRVQLAMVRADSKMRQRKQAYMLSDEDSEEEAHPYNSEEEFDSDDDWK